MKIKPQHYIVLKYYIEKARDTFEKENESIEDFIKYYANDEHLNTALKKICKELGINYKK
jgi:hypothetical protein